MSDATVDLPERVGRTLPERWERGAMHVRSLAPRPRAALDLCGHCGDTVDRVWLVPGDVVDSCLRCFRAVMGRDPVHAQGHSTQPGTPRPTAGTAGRSPAPVASFYLRVDGRRPA